MESKVLKLRHTGSENIGGGQGALIGEDVSFTLATSQDQTLFEDRGSGYIVRRLTPRECERLQGFPDDWTAVEGNSDAQRYKQLGNSMAVPVIRWLGERLEYVERIMQDAD